MMSTMPPDSHKISLKIIDAIKQHPVLYCAEVKSPSIKLQEFRQKVWKRISDELGLDPTWMRVKWKNLRDTYCRILKCKSKTEEGMRRKKWIFEDHLSFLKFPHELDYQPLCIELSEEYVQEINAGGISSEGLLEQLEDRNDDDYSEYLEVLEETVADPTLIEPKKIETFVSNNPQQDIAINSQDTEQPELYTSQEVKSKYRKIRPKQTKTNLSAPKVSGARKVRKTNNTTLDPVSTITNPIIITNSAALAPTASLSVKRSNDSDENDYEQMHVMSDNKNSIELFFASMAQTVKKLPPKAQADIKMNICKIVTEAEVRYSDPNRAQTTQHFITPPGMIPKLVLIPCSKLDNQNGEKTNRF